MLQAQCLQFWSVPGRHSPHPGHRLGTEGGAQHIEGAPINPGCRGPGTAAPDPQLATLAQ